VPEEQNRLRWRSAERMLSGEVLLMKSTPIGFALLPLPSVLLLFALCVVMSFPSRAQTPVDVYVQGQPTVGDPTNTVAATSPSFRDATQFSSDPLQLTSCGSPHVKALTNDAAGQIQAAICALPGSGGTVDARGLGSGITFGSNPFADPTDTTGAAVTGKNVRLLLPAGTIFVNSPIGVPKQSLMEGSGTSISTTLQLGTGFPALISSNCDQSGSRCYPVVAIGVGSDCPLVNVSTGFVNSAENPAGGFVNEPRSQVKHLRIDLLGTNYAVGLTNVCGQESSGIEDFIIADIGNGGRGLNIAETGTHISTAAPNEAQNSSYGMGEIAGTGNCNGTYTTATYGIFVNTGPSVTIGATGHITIDGPNCDGGTNASSNLIAADLSGAGVSIENLHVEKWFDAVRLGHAGSVNGGIVKNVTVAANGPENVVEISNNNNNTVTAAISGLHIDLCVATGMGNCSTYLYRFINDANSGCLGATPCLIPGPGGLASYVAGTGNTSWVQGTAEHPTGNIDLEAGNALTNGSTTAASSYTPGDLGCWTAANTIGSCASGSANLQTVGVLQSKNAGTPVYATVGQVSANSSAANVFTQNDYVCSDAANPGKVVDNATTPCPSTERFIGIVSFSDMLSHTSHSIVLALGAPSPAVNAWTYSVYAIAAYSATPCDAVTKTCGFGFIAKYSGTVGHVCLEVATGDSSDTYQFGFLQRGGTGGATILGTTAATTIPPAPPYWQCFALTTPVSFAQGSEYIFAVGVSGTASPAATFYSGFFE
jgi:hypothetical protein